MYELYRAADFCIVSSLDDGMNLVAKEFVAAREDEDGVLILRTFAGASRELVEALIVNPFDIEETAGAISQALVCRAKNGVSACDSCENGEAEERVSLGRTHAHGRVTQAAAAGAGGVAAR